MSLSHETARDDQLVRYLLGLLTEEEAETVDALCVADDDIAGRLQALENDLVDGYVNGTLARPSQNQFERIYLTTPHRLRKVRFAESLLRVTSRTSAPAADHTAARLETPVARTQPRVQRGRWYESLTWPRLLWPQGHAGWWVAAAAMLLVAMGGLELRAMRLRNELQAVQSERTALERRARELAEQLGEHRASSAENARELERARVALAEAAQAAPSEERVAPKPEPEERLGVLAAILLLPQMRSAGPVPTLVLPAGARTAGFDLLLEPSDFRQYQVTLRDPATNRLLWHSERLTPSSSGRTRTLAIAVPVRVLKASYYSFALEGVNDDGGTDTLAGYAFRIVLR